ncbi:MAG: hypothetical protein ACI8RD_000759 [Bacillariaceae sp.]|jgi:hypothetical protein
METAATTTAPADNNNAAAVQKVVDNISVQPSTSYNTQSADSCNQSVQSAITHGTHPHSPARAAITPLSLSPASSHNTNTNTNNNTSSNNTNQQQAVNIDTMGADVMPQLYGGQQQGDLLLGIRQDEWQVLADQQQQQQQQRQQQQQQQQQQALNNTYQQNRQRSNPVSDDDITEPSSSANTRENTTATTAGATGYTRSDNNTGATSTFGKLIKNATKVSTLINCTCTANRKGNEKYNVKFDL